MSVNEYTCKRCGTNAGDSDETRAAQRLCMTCRDDDAHPNRPLCERCGKRKVTCSEAAFQRGVRVCRGCAYSDAVLDAQDDYAPVMGIVLDFSGLDGYVEQTGGMCMVATVYLDPVKAGVGVCKTCDGRIKSELGTWIDAETRPRGRRSRPKDRCPKVDGPHTPSTSYPQVAFTYDTDTTWTIGYAEHWEDYEGFDIDTSDLRSGVGEDGKPLFGGEYATAEEVAERILLVIDDPQIARRQAVTG